MVHSGGLPSTADHRENPAQKTALARLIASPASTAGARVSQVPLRANYVVPRSGGAGHFGHAKQQTVAPATNTCPAQAFQPNSRTFSWTVPRPLLSPAPQPVQPSDRVVGIGALPLPPRGARFVSQPWPAAPNGNGGAGAPPVRADRCHTTSWAPPPAVRPPPRVGPAFSAGGSPRVRFSRFLPVPDKSFEEFLVERGVLDGPIDASPPPNASPGQGVGLGAVGSGRVECAGLVSGAGGSVVYQGGLATVASLGAGPSGGQMGLSTVRGSEASGAGALGGRGRAGEEAKERRRRRMAKNRESAARARAQKLTGARGSPDDNQGQSEP